jgi:hypothetical protein
MAGVLCVAALSMMTCTSRSAGTLPSIRFRKRRNSVDLWRSVSSLITQSEATSRAA